MNSDSRLSATKFVWVVSLFCMAAVNGNVLFYGDSPGLFNLVGAVVVILAAMITSGFIWSWGSLSNSESVEQAKSKRYRRVDDMLNGLHDDEIAALRERLTVQDEDNDYVLTDDGELKRRRSR